MANTSVSWKIYGIFMLILTIILLLTATFAGVGNAEGLRKNEIMITIVVGFSVFFITSALALSEYRNLDKDKQIEGRGKFYAISLASSIIIPTLLIINESELLRGQSPIRRLY